MWDKFKAFVVKNKWAVGIISVVLILFFFMARKSGGSSQQGTTIISGTPVYSSGNSGQSALSLQLQSQLDALQLNLNSQQHIADSQIDLEKYSLGLQKDLSMYQADSAKALAELNASTQLQLGQLSNQAAHYNVEVAQIEANTNQAQIDAQKYVVGKQTGVEKYKAKTDRFGTIFGGFNSLLQTGSKFF